MTNMATTMNYYQPGSYNNTWDNYTNTTISPYQEILDLHFGGVYVHPHYYQYLEYIIRLPDLYFYLMGIYIGIVGIVGTLGNLLVIYIFCTTRTLRTPPNIFIINLAISDMGFSAINGFPLMTISAFARYWYFGKTGCTIYALIGGLTGFNSIATLACISLDRYYVIAYPFDAMRKCTKKRALMQVVFVWIWSIFLSFPPVFGFGSYIAEGVMIECSFDYVSSDWLSYIYNYLILVLGFFLPVTIIIFCYILIIRAVSSQAEQMRAKAEKMGSDGAKTEKERQQNIKLAKIAAITISLFIISWVPYAIFATAGNNGYLGWVTPTTTQVPVLFAKASATWNPILYALSHPKFRGVLEERFPYLLMCKGSNIDKGDDQSEVTETTKGNLGRQSSMMSDVSVQETVGKAPSGGRMQQETRFNSDNGIQGKAAEVDPRAMTRAANTIFNHLVTAYEGMRVLTTSGDGTGANKVDSSFVNPAFEGNKGEMIPPMGYYGYGSPAMQPGFVPIQPGSRPTSPSPNPVFAVPVATPGMVPYPGYFPAQPAAGPTGQPDQTAEGNRPAVQQHQQQVHLHPHQVQVHQHPHQVQVHQTTPPSHQPQEMQKSPTSTVPRTKNQIITEATVNIEPKQEETPVQIDNTNLSPSELKDNVEQIKEVEQVDGVKQCISENDNAKTVETAETAKEIIAETTVEDLPPPPEEFLDEMEDEEASGEYNMGRSDTVQMEIKDADNQKHSNEEHVEDIEAGNTVITDEKEVDDNKSQGIEEQKAVERIDQAIEATKLLNEASPEPTTDIGNPMPKQEDAAAENDGEADGMNESTSADAEENGNIVDADRSSLVHQDSIQYEDGFV